VPRALHVLWLGGKCFHKDWKITVSRNETPQKLRGGCGGAKTRGQHVTCQCKISTFPRFFYFRIAK
jgi:hypothetical protein